MAGAVTAKPGSRLASFIEAQDRAGKEAADEMAFHQDSLQLCQKIEDQSEKVQAALASQYDPQVSQNKKRKYSIVDPVGKGSFGEVSTAKRQKQDGVEKEATLVVKSTKPGDREALLRAEYEVRALKKLTKAKVSHCPSLVGAFLDSDKDGLSCHTVMERAEGQHLGHYALHSDKRNKITIKDIKTIAHSILEPLAYLESQNMVHGDLASTNVHYDAATRSTKVLDFANCHKVGEDFYGILQTLLYRAPEVILGKKNYDGRIDVWSLGCILFELMKDDVLFMNKGPDGLLETMRDHIELIVWQIGLPPYDFVKDCKYANLFFVIDHKNQRVIGLKRKPTLNPGIRWKDAVGKVKMDKEMEQLIQFIFAMISWNRPKASELLKHPFLAGESHCKLKVNVPADADVAFEFRPASRAGAPFTIKAPTSGEECLHLDEGDYAVTAQDAATGHSVSVGLVDVTKDDSLEFNVSYSD